MCAQPFHDRCRRWFRVVSSAERVYSLPAYALGATLIPLHQGPGPVAWLRGFPRPEVRAGSGTVELGHVALYPGARITCAGPGRVRIGDGSYLNRNTRVQSRTEVCLGSHCMVAWDVVITDYRGTPAAPPEAAFEPVVFGDNVWVGCRAVILGGTRLGDGCIVAAGSIVSGTFPAGAVIAGKPAEVVA